MAALDTTVSVRFLIQDDARQGVAATRLIRSPLDAGEKLFVPVTALSAQASDALRWIFDKTAERLQGAGLLTA